MGTKTANGMTILQRASVVLPPKDQTGTVYNTSFANLRGYAFKHKANGVFEQFGGTAATLVAAPAFTQKTGSTPIVPVDTAYWFAKTIELEDNTTVIFASELKSFFIIAEKIIVGNNVTFTWDRPILLKPNIPNKPLTPEVRSEHGSNGFSGDPGIKGGEGPHGQLAPELEVWVLGLIGSPKIDLRGQDGGEGTQGGGGGDGGPGTEGNPSETDKWGFCSKGQGNGGDGGDGNRAGDGGNGGNGGEGGRFALYSLQSTIDAFTVSGFNILTDGGSGGSGGIPGTPGTGGPGGAMGRVHKEKCFEGGRGPGQSGRPGGVGNRGTDGKKGLLKDNSAKFVPISTGDFILQLDKPAVTSLYPRSAFVGDTVTVDGLRFTSGDKVFIEGVNKDVPDVECKTTFIADSKLTFTVPQVPGGFAFVEIRQADGTTSANRDTLIIKPKLELTIPGGRVRPGEDIFLKGTGFGRVANTWVNGEDIGATTFIDGNTLKIRIRRPSNVENNPAGERVKIKVVNAEGAGQQAFNHSNDFDVTLDTFRIIVPGDSAMWGTGLLEEDKFYTLVANDVRANNGNIGVYLNVEAHTGAKIGAGDSTIKDKIPGELPTRWPTIIQQIEPYLSMPDASEVDLVLMDGGANDISIQAILHETEINKVPEVKQQLIAKANAYCYSDKLVGKIIMPLEMATGSANRLCDRFFIPDLFCPPTYARAPKENC